MQNEFYKRMLTVNWCELGFHSNTQELVIAVMGDDILGC